jgi:Flp pilus assembly protein TadG
LIVADSGSSAAEFGLVLPLLLLFLFGIIDGGRLMWTWNQAEKATQMGARMAVVTTMVPGGLYNADFSAALGQGVTVPTSSFGKATCTKASVAAAATCTCASGSTCPALTPINSAPFNDVVTRMKYYLPSLQTANVQIDYENSGLGYAGNPNGPDVAPLVTVRLTGVTFSPLLFTVFRRASITLPAFSTSLTLEDGAGNVSN